MSELIVALNTVGDLTVSGISTATLETRLHRLAAAVRAAVDEVEQVNDVTRLHHEVASYCYLSATVVELFSADLDEQTLRHLGEPEHQPRLESLATARRALALEPLLSWSLITTFRKQENMHTPMQ
ncbi:hypothetical protein [Amycolatopsis sp. WGS_07]|uniref:hypothetical protein n=1 Tax=Amycolatopsis sp. WGS_07 TaxID=3076764 RepID=UPI00387368C3